MTALSTSQVVAYDVADGVAIVTIDNPPVNASSAEVRAGIIAAVHRAADDREVSAVVLRGTDRHFVTGSDLREFDGVMPTPTLPDVIAVIEASPKPVLAALTGQVLGGGLELALGCDGRVMHKDAFVGLPEVGLGMIPGAGGTQRLPRLIGSARALDVICNGVRYGAKEARELRIADEVADSDVTEVAVRRARASLKRQLLQERLLLDVPGDFEEAARAAVKRSGGRPQVLSAVGAVLMAGSVTTSAALKHERAEFDRLRVSTEARALRHLFFAQRTAAKCYRSFRPPTLTGVGVVGAGTMGQGIARAFAEAGFEVTLLDQTSDAVDAARSALCAGWDRTVARGRMSDERAEELATRVTATTEWTNLAGCQLVIEAVFEEADIKHDVLRMIEAAVPASTVIASNTSYLDLDALADRMIVSTRFAGLHFFAPAHASKVVEVVKTQTAADETMGVLAFAARAIGKTPIAAANGFGFVGNRVFAAYRAECERMVLEGCTPSDVDGALVDFGFAMGPFAVADMSGLDIAWRMRRSPTGRKRVAPSPIADRLCEAGRLGRKTGAGWYRYDEGSSQPIDDPLVLEIIRSVSDQEGMAPQALLPPQIVRRALLAMVAASAGVVADGIANSPDQIDLLLTLGYGFPRHQGGPVFWARNQSRDELSREMSTLSASTGSSAIDLRVLDAPTEAG